ncbi:ylmG homolog protein 1-2, chloroplastic-like [Cornus florida]|uniref:ylmG homolog protein 1-2, chloroplastic-like n=1 Tax=Cornus florida TaxID=4283 RepID=UPI0028A0FE68|nr:ylmG homolog protein 1-2, chloroplastic-like [Cornus florida]
MASQTLNLRIPITCPPIHPSRKHLLYRNPSALSLPSPPAARSKPFNLSLKKSRASVFTSSYSPSSKLIPKTPYYSSNSPTHDHDSMLTKAVPVSGSFFTSHAESAMIGSLQKRLVWRLEPLLPALAAGAAKFLSLYSEILMVRCWLGWFPNIPWERQPFSAIRDLCDPFMSLFRIMIPPIFGLDISTLFAFMALGMLASLLNVPTPTLN